MNKEKNLRYNQGLFGEKLDQDYGNIMEVIMSDVKSVGKSVKLHIEMINALLVHIKFA